MSFVVLSKSSRGDECANPGDVLSRRRKGALGFLNLVIVCPMTCEVLESGASPIPHRLENHEVYGRERTADGEFVPPDGGVCVVLTDSDLVIPIRQEREGPT